MQYEATEKQADFEDTEYVDAVVGAVFACFLDEVVVEPVPAVVVMVEDSNHKAGEKEQVMSEVVLGTGCSPDGY